MSFESRSRDNPLTWSFRVGRIFGIAIRVHLFFVIGAFVVLALAFQKADESVGLISVSESLITIAIMFLIVLLHEFGHCWAARRTGGEATEILLWPLGGLASVQPPHTPRAHFITTAAGPLVNVVCCGLAAGLLAARHGGIGAVPWNPFRTFLPVDFSVDWTDPFQKWLRIVFGISYVLLLFNLLPVYPLDGGRLLHSVLWPRKGYRAATMTATFVGMVGAIVLGLCGVLTGAMLMIMIAVFGYITCYTDRRSAKIDMIESAGEFGYDFSQGYTSLDQVNEKPKKKPGLLERRRRAREEARQQREAEARTRQRHLVDEILAKVHLNGIESLTPEERRVLAEETERKRSSDS